MTYVLLVVLVPSLLVNGVLINREYGRWSYKRRQIREGNWHKPMAKAQRESLKKF